MTSCGVDPRKLPTGIPVLVKGRYPGVVLSIGKRQGWLGLKTPIHIKLDSNGEHIVALPSQVRIRPCTNCQRRTHGGTIDMGAGGSEWCCSDCNRLFLKREAQRHG